MDNTKEAGRPVDPIHFLSYIKRFGGSWLRDALDRDPDVQCGCGSCHICMYRYAEKLIEGDSSRE